MLGCSFTTQLQPLLNAPREKKTKRRGVAAMMLPAAIPQATWLVDFRMPLRLVLPPRLLVLWVLPTTIVAARLLVLRILLLSMVRVPRMLMLVAGRRAW